MQKVKLSDCFSSTLECVAGMFVVSKSVKQQQQKNCDVNDFLAWEPELTLVASLSIPRFQTGAQAIQMKWKKKWQKKQALNKFPEEHEPVSREQCARVCVCVIFHLKHVLLCAGFGADISELQHHYSTRKIKLSMFFSLSALIHWDFSMISCDTTSCIAVNGAAVVSTANSCTVVSLSR